MNCAIEMLRDFHATDKSAFNILPPKSMSSWSISSEGLTIYILWIRIKCNLGDFYSQHRHNDWTIISKLCTELSNKLYFRLTSLNINWYMQIFWICRIATIKRLKTYHCYVSLTPSLSFAYKLRNYLILSVFIYDVPMAPPAQ